MTQPRSDKNAKSPSTMRAQRTEITNLIFLWDIEFTKSFYDSPKKNLKTNYINYMQLKITIKSNLRKRGPLCYGQGFHLRPEAGRFVRSFAIPRPVL